MIWPRQAMRMRLTGMTQNLLFNMYKTENAESITLFVEGGHYRLLNRNHEARIKAAFSELTNDLRDIHFVEGLPDGHETPAMWRARMNAERLETVKENLYKDPVVQALIEEFDGQLIENSVQALGEIS
jgi:DNA polymerase-3 subunit gamma/tau